MPTNFTPIKLNSINLINETTRWLEFERVIDAQPGQFVMAWLPGIGEKPYSIAAMDPLGLLVVDVGPFSHALQELHPGDVLWIKGPLGQGFQIAGRSHLLVGGGYGAAPLYPLAKAMTKLGHEVPVCLGARTQSGLLMRKDFELLGCTFACATEDGSAGTLGLVTKLVEEMIGESKPDTLYACGPEGLLSALASICQQHRINYQLSWEAHMRCGMGLCGSCEVPVSYDSSLPVGWLACYDGPVYHHKFLDGGSDQSLLGM